MLPSKDRLFTKLVLEAPKITPEALDIIISYCHEEVHVHVCICHFDVECHIFPPPCNIIMKCLPHSVLQGLDCGFIPDKIRSHIYVCQH